MAMLFLFCVMMLTYATTADGEARIVGGDKAPPAFGLFHASLQNLTGSHVCGGAIVSRYHVVTAAHCLYGAQPEYIKVIVGTTDLNTGGIKYEAASINIYDGFNFTSRTNDIALLKVKEPFDRNHVRTIPLNKHRLLEGDVVFLSGFGADMVNGETSTQMHLLTIPVFSQTTCEYAMRYTKEITDDMFCTFTKIGQGTCNGDSGSPIIKDDQLVGVVSWGIPCAVGFPDVHTRVTPFIQWIRTQIKNDICEIKCKY